MNIDKAKILLDKINVLMRSIAVAPNQVAEIEKDLMKNYIRQLYESVLEEDGVIVKTPSKPLPTKKQPAPKPAVVAPVAEPEIAPVQTAAPVVVSAPKPVPTPKPKPTPPPPPPPPVPEPVIEVEVVEPTPTPAPTPTPKPVPKPVFVPAPISVNPDLEEIFNLPNATDLGEKLSQSNIKDLTKAFSINDKILTIKELFGGDNALFQDTLKALNKMSSFEEAKNYLLTNVASKNDWVKASKQKKAKVFAKLIKRRFN